jgi:hypothetical protein
VFDDQRGKEKCEMVKEFFLSTLPVRSLRKREEDDDDDEDEDEEEEEDGNNEQ